MVWKSWKEKVRGVEKLERESERCGIVFERGVEKLERESERCGKV